VTNLIVFATVWLFHRRVVQSEAARETAVERAATIRRLYTYLIAAIGLAMLAIGTAGAIGVFGSELMGLNTHGNGETAVYIALVIVGAPAWALAWWPAQRRLTVDEQVALVKVPAAWPHKQNRHLLIEPVRLLAALNGDRAFDCVELLAKREA